VLGEAARLAGLQAGTQGAARPLSARDLAELFT